MLSPLQGLHLLGDNGLFQTWIDGPPMTRFVRICRQCGGIFEGPLLDEGDCGAKHALRAWVEDNFHLFAVHNRN